MKNLPINANIQEIDGAYYQVFLKFLPRIGDEIELYSFLDASTKHPATHYYEVVRVVHEIRDVVEKIEQSHNGSHFVTVHVKRVAPKEGFTISEEALRDLNGD